MLQNVEYKNYLFLTEWIDNNPNLRNIIFKDNTIISSNGKKIQLGDFLISYMLNNLDFRNEITTMDEDKFIWLVDVQCKAKKILSDSSSSISDDYIKTIYGNDEGYAVLITSNNKKVTIKKPLSMVSNKYYSMLDEYDNYVPVDALLSELSIRQKKYDIKFFDLLNKAGQLSDEDKEYIDYVSDFVSQLLLAQDYLVEDAKDLLSKYVSYLRGISLSDKQNEAQAYALKLYEKYANEYTNSLLKIYKEELKKEAQLNRASYGYSSIVLLVASVIATLALIAIIILR